MWHEGTIGLDGPENTTILAHYWIKAYDTGSEYGINGGRISKLQITINGRTVANYDRGWDIKPDESNKEVMQAYTVILDKYN